MSDDRTRTADPRPDAATPTPPADAGATASDGRTPNPDSTRPSSRPHGDAPAGVVSIPGYEVRGELARGGMGRVLEAYDLTFGREVAIKVVLPGPDAAATAGRFVRESRITGRLTHPGIPPAYQLGELPDGSPFLAMKLVRGRTLAALLAERQDVGHDLPRFVSIFEQVCQAVGYAHSRGIIHRDLKPANVMVGAFGEVQVMDWGLARDSRAGSPDPDGPPVRPWDATGSTVGDDRTQAGAVMGTPAYMAPEQARGEEVDARADVFALGGLLAMILVGRAPFQSTNAATAIALAASGETAEVLAALGDSTADAELVVVARRCLVAASQDRPTDGREVDALVAMYRQGVEDRLRAAERDRAAAEARATEQRKRRRVQAGLATAVVLLVAGAGGVAVWRVDENGRKRAEALQLEGEERDRKIRAADAVAALLDQAKVALEAGDATRAAPPLAQAERRATDDAVTDHIDRFGAYRTALFHLRALDGVDNYSWTPNGTNRRPIEQVVDQWASVFRDIGIVPGTTPPAEAAARVSGSPIRDSLLAALHGWLVG